MKITLPSGNTVTLIDPSTIRVKDRNRIMEAGDSKTTDFAKGVAFNEALIATIVEDWSFDLLIPSVKIDSIGELFPADYDRLVEVTNDYVKALFPSLQKNEANEADPKAITDNSKD